MCPGVDLPALPAGAFSPVDAVRDVMSENKQWLGIVSWVAIGGDKDDPMLVVLVYGWESSSKHPDKALAAELGAVARRMRCMIRVL